MASFSRRKFLQTSLIAAGATLTARSWAQVAGANSDIRVAIVGLNGKGRDHLRSFATIPGVRVVALCDVDTAVLDRALEQARAANVTAKTFTDLRDLLKQPDIDAVAIATPNHQHVLQAIWAMQAGKDVFVEKPVSHNIWEGQQLVAATRKYDRIVQAGTQNRSSAAIAEAIAWTRAGHLGKITCARGLCYKRRPTIGLTKEAQTVPGTVDYDLWLGPAPEAPLHRTRFHYDWHWQWETGNGEIANQGNHQIDVARRFLGEAGLPPRVFSIGGRFGYEDDGQTPNTLLISYDYAAVPLLFEVRGLPAKPDALSTLTEAPAANGITSAIVAGMDRYRGVAVGNIIHCEGGHVAVGADYASASAFDRDGKVVQEFKGGGNIYANFIDAVRSRKAAGLHAPIIEGHVSSALAHLANISYRVGKTLKPDDAKAQLSSRSDLNEAFGRLTEHLAINNVALEKTPLTFGAPLTIDVAKESFTGENKAAASAYLTREYRTPFVVPQIS